MIKKVVLSLTLFLMVFISVGCHHETPKELTDAEKFKQEYESVNNTSNSSGKQYRTISISDKNPFIYKTADEIVQAIENEETFVVYFGFKTCPWCRSVLPTLEKVSSDLQLMKIYYVDVLDIRDTLSLENGEVVTTKKGSDGYYKLLDKLANVLEDYTLTENKKTIKTGEKRIFAPNVVAIVKGEAVALTTGVSKLQTDGYMELTDQMINETYQQFETVINEVVNADISCEVGC